MTDTRYHAFASIRPKPEHFAAAREAISGIIPQTLAEPGCHVFTLHEGYGGTEGRLYLYEIFEDEAAFAHHHAQAYTKAVFKQYEAWLAEPVEIVRLRRLS